MIVKKTIGKLPTLIGEYDSSKVYGQKNRVTLYGSEFESIIDNNTYAPATLDNDKKTVTFDTEHWVVISNGTGAFLAGEKLNQFSFQENPEFVSVKTDSDGNMVESTNVEGKKTFYGDVEVKGDFINEALKDRIEEYTDSKVDKEDGKSLIDKNVSDSLSEEDNTEYIKALTDSVGKLIEAIGIDGIRKFFAGINIQGISQCVIDNPDYTMAWVDKENRIIFAIQHNGNPYFGYGVPKQIKTVIDNLNTDLVNKYTEVNQSISDTNKHLSETSSDIDKKINLGNDVYPSAVHEVSDYEDYSQLLCDKDNKIIDSIDDKGTVIHNSKHIFKGGIKDTTGKLVEEAYNHVIDKSSDLARVLREKGDMVSSTDWSDSKSLEIPEPRCAYINITSSDGAAATWPTTKTANKKYWMQFWDMQGNYFKKRIIFNAQGNSSMGFIKKNGAIDICNDEWIGDDTFKIKFGNWLAFDSFHLKAYYTDFFKGVSVMAYKLADEVELSRDVLVNRPWKRQLLSKYTFGTDQTNSAQINDLSLQLDNEAKCHPDAFPCIVYLDGEFYGIYAFSIKKHRDNYHMNKGVAENIHLDGTLNGSTIWNGTIDWTAFEIRNPKNLYYKEAHNGTYEYDADMAQAEIAGDDEVNAWIAAGKLPDGTKISSKIEKRLKTTAKVKNYIIRLSKALATINAETDAVKRKTLFESYFDALSLIDYEIVQLATGDTDGFSKNWQWITLDGKHWSVCEYDKDMSFGGYFTGQFTQLAPTKGGWAGNGPATPMGLTISLYKDDIVSMWKELTNSKILTTENIISIADDWVKRIGTDNFKKEYKKWDESPCCRADLVDTEHWKRNNEYKSGVENNTYDSAKTYAIGETCYYGFGNAYKFTATAETTGNPPLTGHYNNYPKDLGYYDSFWRLVNYIKQRISVENDFINSL